MKKLVMVFSIFILLSTPVIATEQAQCPPTPKASADLERMKSLAGHWEGTTQDGDAKAQPAVVEYKVTSGGSAVIETLFPGTSHEMVSVYHDKNGKLAMTHYCMLGNQPELELKNSPDSKMQFDMSTDSQTALSGQMHMHSLVLERSVSGELVQSWTGMGADGKMMHPTVIHLKKV